jgi:hypothetical protein
VQQKVSGFLALSQSWQADVVIHQTPEHHQCQGVSDTRPTFSNSGRRRVSHRREDSVEVEQLIVQRCLWDLVAASQAPIKSA